MKGFYINLDERLDRLEHIEKLKQKYGFLKDINRLKAYKNKSNGLIGCGVSHIKAIEKMLEANEEYFLIIEDDLVILNHNNFLKFQDDLKKIIDKEWDIIVLTPRGDRDVSYTNYDYANFSRITNNQTATGYIVKKHFAPKLIEILRFGMKNLIRGGNPNIYANDQIWKQLQPNHIFLYYQNIFAGQLAGFSSIQNCDTDYNERFLSQS